MLKSLRLFNQSPDFRSKTDTTTRACEEALY